MLTIVIMQGNDGRYTYCPQEALSILRPQYLPGEFDTVEKARSAIKANKTVPSNARIVVRSS